VGRRVTPAAFSTSLSAQQPGVVTHSHLPTSNDPTPMMTNNVVVLVLLIAWYAF
jgi:hypothetical protein